MGLLQASRWRWRFPTSGVYMKMCTARYGPLFLSSAAGPAFERRSRARGHTCVSACVRTRVCMLPVSHSRAGVLCSLHIARGGVVMCVYG